MFATEIRPRRVDRMRTLPHWRWHLDEFYMKINDLTHYLWCALDHKGEVCESFVTKTRDKKAALKLLTKTLKRHGRSDQIVTDRLRSYGAALREHDINYSQGDQSDPSKLRSHGSVLR